MEFDYFHVDAFSSVAFSGNPAAICVMKNSVLISDAQLGQIANELNLSETAFVIQENDGPLCSASVFQLRWFTPTVEVRLCGHATLAAAHCLFAHCGCNARRITFNTLSGPLIVERGRIECATPHSLISMTFPVYPPTRREGWRDGADPIVASLLQALLISRQEGAGHVRTTSTAVQSSVVESVWYASATKKLFVVLHSRVMQGDGNRMDGEAVLAALSPDTRGMQDVDQGGADEKERVTGVAVTVQAGPENDGYSFCSRYFSPWNGISEDPVNGSSHTSLGPLWAGRLGLWPAGLAEGEKVGPVTIVGRALSSRGGRVHVTLVPASDKSREVHGHVLLSGEAVTVAQGRIRVGMAQHDISVT